MNTLKTFILLAGLTALFGGVGYGLGGQQGMTIALVVAVAMNAAAYWNADKMVLALYGAKRIESGPLVRIVEELANKAQLPMPQVYIIDSSQPNAFATGRNPSHAAIAATRGILEVLDERALRAVLAHELAHIKNRDTFIMTLTATIAGALSTLAHFTLFFGAGQRDRSAGPLATLLMIILAPLAAMLVQLAISRTREYEADKGGARISGDPLALAEALEKIEQTVRRRPNDIAEGNPGTAHLFIINPLSGRVMDRLFATHPDTANRVRILQGLAKKSDFIMHDPQQGPFHGPSQRAL